MDHLELLAAALIDDSKEQVEIWHAQVMAAFDILGARQDMISKRVHEMHGEMKSNYVGFQGWVEHFASQTV